DDPALDKLAQECFEGVMDSCDSLFFESEIDSAYETYAETCGGRIEVGEYVFCSFYEDAVTE
ncbi:MAG: hypothetical protein ACR2KO_04550, partial [Geodermatophilaceae bacterium]